MIKYNTPQELFTAICDKIRDKIGSNELINHQDIPDKIDNLVDSDIINEYNELLSILNQDTIIELNNNEIENINICFRERTSLTTVNLPKCTSIGNDAFRGCTSLTTIIFGADQVVHIGNNIFGKKKKKNGTGYIYVPDNLVDSYKTATNWSAYANQIKPLSELPSNLKEEYGYD